MHLRLVGGVAALAQPDLARYMARSASRSSTSAAEAPSTARSDARRDVDRALFSSNGFLQRIQDLAARTEPSILGLPGSSSSRTANLAPPRRASVPVGRRQPREPLGDEDQKASPVWWPRLSFTVWKPSRSQKRTPYGRAVRRRAGEATPKAVEEERPVGNAGERIVKRLALRSASSSRWFSCASFSSAPIPNPHERTDEPAQIGQLGENARR